MKRENDDKLIISNDINILKQSQKFIDQRLTSEHERGKAAENRATVMLGIIGAFAVFLFNFIKGIISDYEAVPALVIIVCVITIAFLIKSGYYAIIAIRPLQTYTLTPSLVVDIQNKLYDEALRYEIKWKIWEYNHLLKPNTTRLFWLHRCQRNFFNAVLVFVILGCSLFFEVDTLFRISYFYLIKFIAVAIFWFFFGDILIEKRGLWKK